MLKLLTAGSFLLFLASCNHPAENTDFVPVVGLNSRGHSAVHYVPTKTFQEKMSPFIVNMADEVSTTLDQHEMKGDMPWTLSRVTVGLALETEVDVMEIVEGELEGVIELRFQKKN
jgi:hypothetical protein